MTSQPHESRGVLMDGTASCMCDSPTPRPDGRPRNCEFPCWQRAGITDTPCCPDCKNDDPANG